MKEFKLSAKSKYSVCYLLCGLFMFFFMFAILNLSSYASSPNTRTLSLAPSESYSETYGTYYYTFNPADYDIPITTITTSTGGSGYSQNNYSGTVRGSNTVHLVTSAGDFVVNINQGLADSQSRTVSVLGVPQRAYAEFEAYNNQSSAVSTYASFSVNSISVSDLGSAGGSFGNIYDSYVPVSIAQDVTLNGHLYRAGSPCMFDMGNTSLLHTYPVMPTFLRGAIPSYVLILDYDGAESVTIDTSRGSLTFYQYAYDDSPSHGGAIPTSTWNHYYISGSNHHTYVCFFDLDGFDFNKLCNFYFLSCYSNGTMQNCSVQLLQYSATIGDYMSYVQSEWNDITPAVTDTNQNIAQSVSDIGTAQTFETSAFTDFDSSMTSSGLDSFSLSFASTPLLWCASIINTFYNNMPSGFQYLLMFVAFVGILVIVLNIAGRVVRRFGGD